MTRVLVVKGTDEWMYVCSDTPGVEVTVVEYEKAKMGQRPTHVSFGKFDNQYTHGVYRKWAGKAEHNLKFEENSFVQPAEPDHDLATAIGKFLGEETK